MRSEYARRKNKWNARRAVKGYIVTIEGVQKKH